MRIAVDAMGGDKAPGEIVAGAVQAVDELGVEVLLAGDPDALAAHLPAGAPRGIEVLAASEAIGMDDEPAAAVRARRDASVVRVAEAVRDGRADAMVGAGSTGATMAAAVLRMGRLRGVARPAIAVPIPVPGSHPQLLVDGGATVDCRPEWLRQFALLGREFARLRFGLDAPRVGLLSNGEEEGKGDELRKQAAVLLRDVPGYVGNVEGRDLLSLDKADVVVTDGFTGNVALKTLEGALKRLALVVFGALDSSPEVRDAASVLMPALLDAAGAFDPENTGGAVLLGVAGVCVISHGSSSARAIVSAVRVADEAARAGFVERLEGVIDAG